MAPSTKKDISESPAANGVTKPTDPAFKAADVERKMKFYGVLSALRSGRYPSNAQIDSALDYTIQNSPVEEEKLSADGKKLIGDVRAIIRTAKMMVAEKNRDELAQEFLFNTRQVDYSRHKENLKGVDVPVEKDQAKQDAQQAAEHLRTLLKLVITNSEFRKLLKDSSLLGRDVLADTLSKAADATRPDEAELANADEPAPSNNWEGPDGGKAGPDEKVVTPVQKEDFKLFGRKKGKRDSTDGRASTDVSSPASPTTSPDGTDASSEAKRSWRQRAMGRIPEEHKQRAKDGYKDSKQYLSDKFPAERRERYIYRLKKVVVEQQRHRDYQDAIEFFLDMAETYGGHAKSVGGKGGDKSLQVRQDASYQNAEQQLRTLLERFANGASLQPVLDAVNQIYKDADEDEELRKWFKELDSYVRRVLQEPGYVMREECDRDGRKVWDDGRRFWDDKYRTHRETLFDEITKFFTAYADDPLNVQFGENWKTLTTDLLMDSEGNLKYKPHLWHDIRTVILPQLLEHVGYVPIPRIEYSDAQLDLVIENLTLEGQNLLPNIGEIETRNYFKFSPYSTIQDAQYHSVWVSFSQVQADLRDVAFYVRKKTGFPRLQDSGLADVTISGKGISGKVHIETTDKPGSTFKIVEVKVKVDKIKFAIRGAKHGALYSMVKPLATGLIKKQIANAIQDAIRGGLVQLDSQLVDVNERLKEAGEGEEGPSKMSVLKDSFSRRSDEASEQAKSVKRQSTFKVVASKQSQGLEWNHPDSIVDKQAQKMGVAKEGERWQSPAFDIIGSNPTPAAQTAAA